jgi:hypothetical protein
MLFLTKKKLHGAAYVYHYSCPKPNPTGFVFKMDEPALDALPARTSCSCRDSPDGQRIYSAGRCDHRWLGAEETMADKHLTKSHFSHVGRAWTWTWSAHGAWARTAQTDTGSESNRPATTSRHQSPPCGFRLADYSSTVRPSLCAHGPQPDLGLHSYSILKMCQTCTRCYTFEFSWPANEDLDRNNSFFLTSLTKNELV